MSKGLVYGPGSVFKEIWSYVRDIGITCLVTLLLVEFVCSPAVVQGSSMEPTLHDGEFMVIRKLAYEPKRGDVVTLYVDEMILVKRVIGIAGDTVQVDYKNNCVVINGEVLDEPYLDEAMVDDYGVARFEYVVPDGCVFVLGDNRNHSTDSRSFGCVDEADVIGSLLFSVG